MLDKTWSSTPTSKSTVRQFQKAVDTPLDDIETLMPETGIGQIVAERRLDGLLSLLASTGKQKTAIPFGEVASELAGHGEDSQREQIAEGVRKVVKR